MSATSTKHTKWPDELIRSEAVSDPRCRHKTASGRRCERQPTSANYGFCAIHAAEAQRYREAEATAIASELIGGDSNFGDPAVVNQMLGKLFTLVAQGRIPVSTASLLAQIGQLLVNGLQGAHGDTRLAEVTNAWRQTIVKVLNSADRDSRSSELTTVHYEDLGRQIADSDRTESAVEIARDSNHGEES